MTSMNEVKQYKEYKQKPPAVITDEGIQLSEDIAGQVFGELTAIHRTYREGTSRYWYCECSCGGSRVVLNSNLKGGTATHCTDTKYHPRVRKVPFCGPIQPHLLPHKTIETSGTSVTSSTSSSNKKSTPSVTLKSMKSMTPDQLKALVESYLTE